MEEKVGEGQRRICDYLIKKHETLKDNYTDSKDLAESCSLIAVDLARLLLKEGRRPHIAQVWGKTIKGGINRKPLVPKLYGGRISWGGHIVCCEKDIVYDPLVGKPLNTRSYTSEVFNDPVDINTLVPQDQIEEFINR